MKIGVISDSHDHLEHMARATARFRELGVTRILHAGDIVCPAMILSMAGFEVAAVFGNNDGERAGLMRAMTRIHGRLEGEFLELDAPGGLGRIALYHGTTSGLRDALIDSGGYRLVITGHTHRVVNERRGETLVLNPGSLHGFGKRATAMIYDDDTHTAELIEVYPEPPCPFTSPDGARG
ncbi:MAG: YfcE family phosphodiesterase [Magnetococcales bacterium]|nr:YfcE family phosphodiesterase [Magnetococcales bacterium]MBF0261849.1 YfcE family phosphodiesterase [Magnetococcales bacterium]